MKSLAHQFAWPWPKMDSDLEAKVRSCSTCQMYRNDPPQTVLHPWEWPNKPWTRLHVDYTGKMFLIVVYTYSKWIEVHITNITLQHQTFLPLAFQRPWLQAIGLILQVLSLNSF